MKLHNFLRHSLVAAVVAVVTLPSTDVQTVINGYLYPQKVQPGDVLTAIQRLNDCAAAQRGMGSGGDCPADAMPAAKQIPPPGAAQAAAPKGAPLKP